MKVILLKNVPNIGQADEIVEVKNGYARNYLLPQGLAKIANPGDVQEVQAKKKEKGKEKEKKKKELEQLAKSIEERRFELQYKVGKEDQLFESVNSKKISQALQKEGFEINEDQIDLEKPIESLGEYPVNLNLGNNLESKIIIVVKKLKE
jgi:large subunit ribosomal protein L9